MQNATEYLFSFLNLWGNVSEVSGHQTVPHLLAYSCRVVPSTLGTPGWPGAGMLQGCRAGQSGSA